MTEVSLPTLSNIERGISSPTINILWKISKGLSLPITYFLDGHKEKTELVSLDNLQKLDSSSELVSISAVFKWLPTDNFEMFFVELEEGGSRISQAHAQGTQEILFILNGSLSVSLDKDISCKKNEILRFDSGMDHTYVNTNSGKTAFLSIMVYPMGGAS